MNEEERLPVSTLDSRTLKKTAKRRVLSIDPKRSTAVKRNVHEFAVDVDAASFARAFHQVLTEPDTTFGPIEVRRDPERLGQPFAVGERFHGCFSVSASFPRTAALLGRVGLGGLVTRLENALLSDYAVIATLIESKTRFEASYEYLSGSPIAGESRFVVEPRGSQARLEVVFCYQEIAAPAIFVLHAFAARLHDEVVLEQVRRAASRAGGRIVSSTMDGLIRKTKPKLEHAREPRERAQPQAI